MLNDLSTWWWVLVLMGTAMGFLGGLLGVGGGIIMVPALVLIVGLPQKAAAGIALSVMVPLAIVAATRYWLNTDIHMRFIWVVLIAIGAVVGAWFGADAAARLSNDVLRKGFAIFLIVVGVHMLWTADLVKKAMAPGDKAPPTQINSEQK